MAQQQIQHSTSESTLNYNSQKTKERQTKQAKQILHDLIKSFENPQTLQDAVVKTFLEPIDVPQNKYSRTNRILLALQGADDARGNAVWRQINRFPLVWSKQVFIMIPKTRKIRNKDCKGTKVEEEEKTITTGFFFKGLYDVENTYGTGKNSKVEYVKNPPKKLPPLSDVAQKWGVKIKYKVDSANTAAAAAWGSFNPTKNEIQLGTDNPATFFHELAHKAHEKIDGRLKMEQDPQQETIAQLTAGVLSQMYDQKIDLYTYKYIKGYTQDDDDKEEDPKKTLKLIGDVINKTGQVLELILGNTSHQGDKDKCLKHESENKSSHTGEETNV